MAERDAAAVTVPPPAIFAAMIVIGLVLHFAVREWPTTLDVVQRITAGTVLVLAGGALIAGAFRWFRKTGQDPAPWKPTPAIVVSGPYRFTRNPMYVGMTVITAGIGLYANTSWIVVLAPVGLVLVHFLAVVREEAYLARKFGDAYNAYCRSVPRYL